MRDKVCILMVNSEFYEDVELKKMVRRMLEKYSCEGY